MKITNEIKNTLRELIKAQELCWAEKITRKVKAPKFIPVNNALTVLQVADYFGVSLKRVQGLISSHREVLGADCVVVLGKDIETFSPKRFEYNIHLRKYEAEFDNGTKVCLGRSGNTLMNARALLICSLSLSEESRVALKLFDIIKQMALPTPADKQKINLINTAEVFIEEKSVFTNKKIVVQDINVSEMETLLGILQTTFAPPKISVILSN